MEHRQIVHRFLFPTDQDPPETVQPTVRPFHHPTPRLVARFPLDRLRFFPTAANVGGVAELEQQVPHFLVIIALIQAQSLRLLGGWFRTRDRDALQGRLRQFEVVAVRPVHDQAQRDATPVGEQAALHPPLRPIGGIGTGFFPRPRAPWSSPRPWPATPSRCRRVLRSLTSRLPTSGRRRRPRPTPGSGDGHYYWSRCRWRSGHSIGSQSAARREWRSSPGAGRPADCGSLTGAVCRAAAAVQSPPRVRPKSPTAGELPFPPSLPSCGVRFG